MKRVRFGDLLSVQEGLIVHGCNAQGVMGSGVAKSIKEKYPAAFQTYADFCRHRRSLGEPVLGEIAPQRVGSNSLLKGPELWVVNAITQENFGKDQTKQYVSYKAVHSSFFQVAVLADNLKLDVHYPLIGAGLGNGSWAVISDIIDAVFDNFPTVNHHLWIFEQ